jgi:hypothetical protein
MLNERQLVFLECDSDNAVFMNSMFFPRGKVWAVGVTEQKARMAAADFFVNSGFFEYMWKCGEIKCRIVSFDTVKSYGLMTFDHATDSICMGYCDSFILIN